MDTKLASTRFKMEMAKKMFNNTPKAVSKSNLSGLYKSMSDATKSVGSSTAKTYKAKPALKLLSSSENRVNSRLNNLKRRFIDSRVSSGMSKNKARSLATEFDDASEIERALGMANPSKVKAAPTFGGLTGGAVEFKKAASISDEFFVGFEKIALKGPSEAARKKHEELKKKKKYKDVDILHYITGGNLTDDKYFNRKKGS